MRPRMMSTISRSRTGIGSAFDRVRWTGFNRARRELRLGSVDDDDGRQILPERIVPYDTLIFCVGSTTNDFGIPGVAAHAISLDTPLDAERFHRRLLAAAVRADGEAAEGRPAHVDIVVIGAGATGVELAAEIRQTTRTHAVYGLDTLDPTRDIRLTVLEAAPRILPQLGERIATAATELLGTLGIAVRTKISSHVSLKSAGAAWAARQHPGDCDHHCAMDGRD